ncbi:tRNA (guanine-N(7)-)-methyltransferase [Bacteriovoracaceae bacterium]|nr:tRNA (guanine-N(7)-)-methyltransferase [Bacteriovoracaceae bacterium]
MSGGSRNVSSPQIDIHENMDKIIERHLRSKFQKPYAQHTEISFKRFVDYYESKDFDGFILDNGCGAGESSFNLAKMNPTSLVLGIDRSAVRLNKADNKFKNIPDNLIYLRADLVDFWRMLASSKYRPLKQFFFYPNPYPKAGQVKNRWHAHPVFLILLSLGGDWEIRSNWELYLREMQYVIKKLTGQEMIYDKFTPSESISLFEKKYLASKHDLFRGIISFCDESAYRSD